MIPSITLHYDPTRYSEKKGPESYRARRKQWKDRILVSLGAWPIGRMALETSENFDEQSEGPRQNRTLSPPDRTLKIKPSQYLTTALPTKRIVVNVTSGYIPTVTMVQSGSKGLGGSVQP